MEEIIKELSLKYNKDKRVIKLIAEHPLLFTRHCIEDINNNRPIMIPYLGKFIFKTKKTLDDKRLNTIKYFSKQSIAKIGEQII